jgi:hypothetical protein
MAANRTPYVGPTPFDEDDEDRFFGRRVEIAEIVSFIYSQPQLLIYSSSGAGKTSLINAGIIPTLRKKEGLDVLPVARVRPREGAAELHAASGYMLEALLCIAPDRSAQSLSRKPLSSVLAELPVQAATRRRRRPRVLFFDQFEEILTPRSDRFQEEQDIFFEQIAAALKEDPLLRVVFLVREDNVAQLEPFAWMLPEGLGVRYRLERLSRQAALDAIVCPVKSSGRRYGPGAAERLVDRLLLTRAEVRPGTVDWVPGRYVEPVQLQVVCESLWRRTTTEEITSEQIEQLGDVTQALAGHYDTAVQQVSRQFEFPEQRLRQWFDERLITPMMTRGTVFQGPELTDEAIPNPIIEALDKEQHVLRREPRAAGYWYELVHDTFIEPVLHSNRKWFKANRYQTPRLVRIALPVLVVVLLAAVGAAYAQRLRSTQEAAGIPWLSIQKAGTVSAGAGERAYDLRADGPRALILRLTGSGGLHPAAEVLGPDGRSLPIRDLDAGPDITGVVDLSVPGQYRIRVSGANQTTGSFELTAGAVLRRVKAGDDLSMTGGASATSDVYALENGTGSRGNAGNSPVLAISRLGQVVPTQVLILAADGTFERQLRFSGDEAVTVLDPGLHYLIVERELTRPYRLRLEAPTPTPLPKDGRDVTGKLLGGNVRAIYTGDSDVDSVQISQPSGGPISVVILSLGGVLDERVLDPTDISGLEHRFFGEAWQAIVIRRLTSGSVTYRVRAVREAGGTP